MQFRIFGAVSTPPLQALMPSRPTHLQFNCQSPCAKTWLSFSYFFTADLASWPVLKRYESNSGFELWTNIQESCASGMSWMACPWWCRQGPLWRLILTRLRSISQILNRFIQEIDGVSLTDEDGQKCPAEARFENDVLVWNIRCK